MSVADKRAFREAFFRLSGENVRTFAEMMDASTELCFYIKDKEGRIVALNRRNREICNIPNEISAIGLTSQDLFPPHKAESYMELDRRVLETGKPIIDFATVYPADDSDRLMINDVRPLRDAKGDIIGTVRMYRLEEAKLTPVADPTPERKVRNAVTYIRRHYAEKLTQDIVAHHVGLSVSTFKRGFTRLMKMPFGRFLAITRINAAREFLEHSALIESEIALRTGFHDASHLSVTFTRLRGITPGAYRRQHRATADSAPTLQHPKPTDSGRHLVPAVGG